MQHSSSDAIDKAQDPPLSATSLPDGLRSPSISGSTPDHDLDNDIDLPDLEPELDHACLEESVDQKEAQAPLPQKRKGGRKPIYATSEERKQRNRQAQAAFRERRTEYIKQLESTIKQHEDALATLQASHRSAADECLMLRYKNSLLERILQEKNIDVQVELAAKTGSPNLGPTRYPNVGVTSVTSPGLTRFAVGKYGGRRPLSMSAKSDVAEQQMAQTRSPLALATPASQMPSPIAPMTKSPNFVPQSGNLSPALAPLSHSGQPLQPLRPAQPIRPQFNGQNRGSFAQSPLATAQTNPAAVSPASAALVARDSNNFFVSPFQNHYDQLDEEYNAQANMLDDNDADHSAFNSTSYAAISNHANPAQTAMTGQAPPNPNIPQSPAGQRVTPGGDGAQMLGLPAGMSSRDPLLDADPFGLSASMYFPTPYSFDAHR